MNMNAHKFLVLQEGSWGTSIFSTLSLLYYLHSHFSEKVCSIEGQYQVKPKHSNDFPFEVESTRNEPNYI